MDHGTHPDLVLVAPMEKDPEKSKADERLDIDRVAGKLYVSQGREIVRTAQLRPVEGRYKVFHIQDAQLAAGHEFFSVLLKTLEEPPPHVILCITATERATVLPTVVSRCQPIEMQPLTVEQVTSALSKGWGATAEDADLLARLSGGRLGWAVEQLAGKSSLADRRSQMGEMLALLGADRCERLAAAERYAQWKQGMGVLDLWISWWRDLLLLQNECGDGISNVDLQPVLQSQAAALGRDEVRRYVDTVTQVTQWVKTTNVNKRLALDVLMLQMPRMKV
jgi:DNA polymerase-3 subunit delta'